MKKFFNEFEDFSVGDRVFILDDGWHKIISLNKESESILCKSENTKDSASYKASNLYFAEFSLPDAAFEKPKKKVTKEFNIIAAVEKWNYNKNYDLVADDYGFKFKESLLDVEGVVLAKINIKFEVEE